MKKLLFIVLLSHSLSANSQVMRKRVTKLMGGRFDITIVANDSLSAEHYIDTVISEISRIENQISDWKADTQISEVNRNAGVAPVKVTPEVFALVERAIHLSEITNGAFDVSFAAMDKIWKFDGSMTKMPAPDAVKKSVEKVGYRKILLNAKSHTIFLKQKGMKIGFGALGEGYATDKCRDMMMAKGIKAGIVNGSGDMSTWGKQPDGSNWKVGITNPMHEDTIFAVIPLKQSAVVTSGSYQKFILFNGKRYSHIINPATGYPATGLCSVTVFGPSAETANGLSTSIMVLGKDNGIKLLKKYPAYSCIMINDDGRIFTKNINIKKYKL